MNELDEVAQAIFEQHREFFPVNFKQAQAIAWAHLGDGETMQVIDGVAEALTRIKA